MPRGFWRLKMMGQLESLERFFCISYFSSVLWQNTWQSPFKKSGGFTLAHSLKVGQSIMMGKYDGRNVTYQVSTDRTVTSIFFFFIQSGAIKKMPPTRRLRPPTSFNPGWKISLTHIPRNVFHRWHQTPSTWQSILTSHLLHCKSEIQPLWYFAIGMLLPPIVLGQIGSEGKSRLPTQEKAILVGKAGGWWFLENKQLT